MSSWGDRLGVFDLETTGVDVDTSRIVSACIAVLDGGGAVLSRWNWLADPGIEIPEGASAVHGITTERARAEGRSAPIVVAEIAQTLRVLFDSGIPVTVYNAPYDLSLLDRECRRYGIDPLVAPSPVIDPLVIDKAVDRYRKGKRTLEVTAELYQVSLEDAHDAGADAIAAGRVALALLRSYPDELDVSLADLQGRQEVWYAEQAASFQEYLRAKRGDDSYVADTGWPLKTAGDPSTFVDTQPIPPLPPRPSGNVPVLDFSEFRTRAIESSPVPAVRAVDAAQRFDSEAYRLAAPPTREERVEHGVDEPFVADDDDAEPAWIIEPSSVPSVSIDQERDDEQPPFDERDDDEPPFDERDDDEPPFDEHDVNEVAGVIDSVEVIEIIENVEPSDHDVDDAEESLAEPDGVEPLSATDAVGEPEQEDEAPAGPPPAVLRIAAAIVTDADGRCLLVRKAGTTVFMQAGGKLEPGESAVDALARELREELDLELDESTAEYLGVFRAEAANEPNTLVSAAVFALQTAAEIQARGEIEELLWIDQLDEVDVELAPLTRDELLPLWASRRAGATLF